ncbi:MAG: PLDc N-terminal domain-containing protein [Eubacterium sp.]|nr:PLDc N-terminal domain-containing protein [Eubacterium sp.]
MNEKKKPSMKRYKNLLFGRALPAGILIALQLFWIYLAVTSLLDFFPLLNGIMRVLSIIFVIVILNDRGEQSEYRLIWIIVVLLLPVFGAPFYYLFGNRKPGRNFKRRLEAANVKYHLSYFQDRKTQEAFLQKDVRGAGTSSYIFNEQCFPVHQNTNLTYYSSGETLLEGMMEAIRKAEHFIFLEYFTIEVGDVWEPMLNLLIDKAEQGVEVCLLYDDFGCSQYLPRKYNTTLNKISPNFKCLKYNRMVPFFSVFMNNRDHRKMLIVDGYIGFTGGMNLSDRYVNINCPYGKWKDAGIRLIGDGVWNLTLMFLEMWEAVDVKAYRRNRKKSYLLRRLDKKLEHNRQVARTQERLAEMDEEEKAAFMGMINDLKDYMPNRYHTSERSEAFVQPYGDDPFDEKPLSENVYIELINQAKRRIYIFTPYLIMSDELTRAVCIAARRGVDVRIVVPGIPDKKMVYRLTKSAFPYLKQSGVRIYIYTPGFLHSKCMLCDSVKGVVGTVNFDYRSLFLHFEDAVFFSDAKTASRLYLDFRETFKISHEVTDEDTKRTVPGQVLDSLLRVIAPML